MKTAAANAVKLVLKIAVDAVAKALADQAKAVAPVKLAVEVRNKDKVGLDKPDKDDLVKVALDKVVDLVNLDVDDQVANLDDVLNLRQSFALWMRTATASSRPKKSKMQLLH